MLTAAAKHRCCMHASISCPPIDGAPMLGLAWYIHPSKKMQAMLLQTKKQTKNKRRISNQGFPEIEILRPPPAARPSTIPTGTLMLHFRPTLLHLKAPPVLAPPRTTSFPPATHLSSTRRLLTSLHRLPDLGETKHKPSYYYYYYYYCDSGKSTSFRSKMALP